MTMKGLVPRLAITATLGSLLCSNPAAAQIPPPAKKTARVEIAKGPEVELSKPHVTIIRWTTNNPGGSDDHYGVVQYGTDPKDLNKTAKSPLRLNQGHAHTTFRVRLDNLEPRTTYYYRVATEESSGRRDPLKSPVSKFTMPGPGERIPGSPQSGRSVQPIARQ